MNSKPKIDQEDFEWTAAELKAAKKFADLPKSLQTKLASRKPRGTQVLPTKISTTIRLSSEVIDSFKATGAGWQTRIDLALKEWLKEHELASWKAWLILLSVAEPFKGYATYAWGSWPHWVGLDALDRQGCHYRLGDEHHQNVYPNTSCLSHQRAHSHL